MYVIYVYFCQSVYCKSNESLFIKIGIVDQALLWKNTNIDRTFPFGFAVIG